MSSKFRDILGKGRSPRDVEPGEVPPAADARVVAEDSPARRALTVNELDDELRPHSVNTGGPVLFANHSLVQRLAVLPANHPPPSPPPKSPGRPKGKRSDPAFEQVSCYLPKDLYRDVRIALLKDGRSQEFSVVVAELLSGWLQSRPGG